MNVTRYTLGALLICLAAPRIFLGQTEALSSFNPLSSSIGGLHLYGVTFSSGYYFSGAPFGLTTPQLTSSGSSTPTVSLGVAASIGWSKTTPKSTVSIIYDPSYSGSPTNSLYDSFSNRAVMSWNRKLGGKWSMSASASGMLANFQQLLFSESGLSAVASSPATFGDLASAALQGTYTNAQVASLLTGAQLLASPEQTYLYGNRLLSATAHVGLTWAPTTRTSFQMSVSGTRSQNYQDNPSSATSTTASVPLVPRTTAATVDIGWSYSLSPRTQIGIDGASSRTWSSLVQGYASRGNVSLGRTLTEHFFVQLHGGAGVLTYIQLAAPQPKSVQYVGGGSVGYKARSHTFLASYDRSIGDSYGLGAATSSVSTVAWNWRPPGSTWSLSSSFGYQQLGGTVYNNTASWRVSAAIAKKMGRHMFMSLQYGYFQIPSTLAVQSANSTQDGVSLSVTWSPSTYQ